MKLTPLDIRKQEFKKVMRGYDPVEVETFMEMMANESEELMKQQKQMRDRIIELETQLKDYRQIEKTLQQTLLQAQETTGKTYEAARRETELILKEAEMKAAKIVEQANADLVKLQQELQQLHARKDSIIGRLRVLLSSELDLIKTMEMSDDRVLHDSTEPSGGQENDVELDEIIKNLDDDRSSKTH